MCRHLYAQLKNEKPGFVYKNKKGIFAGKMLLYIVHVVLERAR